MSEASSAAVASGASRSLSDGGWQTRLWQLRAWPVTLADQAIVSLANFGTGILVAHNCSKEQAGLYSLAMVTAQLCQTFPDTLVNHPYTVYSPRSHGREHAAYTGSTLFFHVLLSLAVSVGLFVWAGALWLMGDHALAVVLCAVGAFLTPMLLRQWARQMSFVTGTITAAVVLDGCVVAVQGLGLWFLWSSHSLSPLSAVLAIGFATTVAVAGWLGWLRSRIEIQRNVVLEHWRRNWTFARWLLGSGLLWTLSLSLYPWLLKFFHGTEAAADWGFSQQVIGLVSPLMQGLQNVSGPRISHAAAAGGLASLRRSTYRSAAMFAMVLVPMCLALVVSGGWLVQRFYGANFHGNGGVVAAMAINVLALGLTFPFSRALFALERSDIDFKVNVGLLVMLLTIGIGATWRWGTGGAAIVQMTGAAFSLAFQYFAFKRLAEAS